MMTQELELFKHVMHDVIPIKKNENVVLKKPDEVTPGQQYRHQKAQYSEQEIQGPLSLVLRKPLQADDWISYKSDGIQTGVYKNVRLGRYPHEAVLNLIRKSPKEARDELLQFMNECEECNIRSVLISFGHGKNSGTLLKSYLAQWLPELKQVQACHTAQKQHGGSGAVYVLLRKSEAMRAENRERHAARLGG
ncbi:MAG: DNA endonuclease SmrA [Methylomicrobium sp.]|nr:DNA endonuclease SmrA [Methylomicrobium sp.]